MDLHRTFIRGIVIGTVTICVCLQFSTVHSGVTSFRVYNEKRILDRLASAPVVPNPVYFSHRAGVSYDPKTLPASPLTRKARPGKRKKRIRKVIRQRTTTTTTELSTTPIIQDETLENNISPLNNYNQRDIEIYNRPRRRRKRPKHTQQSLKDTSDLQRAESGNPFVNSSAPISPDFSGDGGGLQFHIQILHPLLNEDSVLSHYQPKLPENKTVNIMHELSDEVAGNIPVAPDLKKVRRKHPLQNPDSVISGQTQVSKNEPKMTTRGRGGGKSKERESSTPRTVAFVDAVHDRPPSTAVPPITSQTVGTTRQRARSKSTTAIPFTTTPSTTTSTTPSTTVSTTPSTTVSTTSSTTTAATTTSTTLRPTIRLTNPPLTFPTTTSTTTTSTTTTERPAVFLSSVPYTPTSIPSRTNFDRGNPQVIIFPPEDDVISPVTSTGARAPVSVSPEQEILNQLFGLGQSTAGNFGTLQPTIPTPAPANTNFFDLFNIFQSTTPSSLVTTSPRAAPIYPPTTIKPRRTTETQYIFATTPPPTTTTPSPRPTQSQAELDNLLQLTLLEGLLQRNSQGQSKPGDNANQNDLSSLFNLLGGQNVVLPPRPVPTSPPTPAPTNPTSLQAALNNMLSVLTNPFGQQRQQPQSTNIFGGGGGLFGGNSLFSGGNNGDGLLGGNSLFNLRPGASSQRTTVVPSPTTTAVPKVSENELLSQILQLGIAADQQERKNPSHKVSQPKPQDSVPFDLQSILGSNWNDPGGKSTSTVPATQQPSETMQLLNILFNNNQKPTTRPSGPYWWLDMNAFMGNEQNSDPMAGIRPKLGQREYFVKVRR